MTDEQNQQDPQSTVQEAPATSGEPFTGASSSAITANAPVVSATVEPSKAADSSTQQSLAPLASLSDPQEAGGAAAGESDQSSSYQLPSQSPSCGAGTANAPDASDTENAGISVGTAPESGLTTDAPAVAEPGEGGSQPATERTDRGAGFATQNVGAQQESIVLVTGIGEVNEPGEGAASLVGSQSASDTSSSASLALHAVVMPEDDASEIQSAIARLRDHLWTFEHSAVRHLHAELDKIEALFK